MVNVEIVPAILVKSREEFGKKIAQVAPHVKRVQIDIMDGKFVPNATLPVEELRPFFRQLNDNLAAALRAHPGRFLGVAALPTAGPHRQDRRVGAAWVDSSSP